MNRFKHPFLLSSFCLCLFSCSATNDALSKQDVNPDIFEMFAKIEEIASSVKCENASEWKYTSYGSKPCGGPQGYIAYSTSIDTDNFLKLIEEHKIAEKKYNEEQGLVSDCSVPTEPTGVICENDAPVLVY